MLFFWPSLSLECHCGILETMLSLRVLLSESLMSLSPSLKLLLKFHSQVLKNLCLLLPCYHHLPHWGTIWPASKPRLSCWGQGQPTRTTPVPFVLQTWGTSLYWVLSNLFAIREEASHYCVFVCLPCPKTLSSTMGLGKASSTWLEMKAVTSSILSN